MIPPLLLDVEPHHYVSFHVSSKSNPTADLESLQCLDMCAAPGSKVNIIRLYTSDHIAHNRLSRSLHIKTAQIMEALNPHTSPTTGLLIANDADAKRCHMLVHQTGRMPSIGLGVTCNDAGEQETCKALRPLQRLTRDRSTRSSRFPHAQIERV